MVEVIRTGIGAAHGRNAGRYNLGIKGFPIAPGQSTTAVGLGTIVLSHPLDADGIYIRDTLLTLVLQRQLV